MHWMKRRQFSARLKCIWWHLKQTSNIIHSITKCLNFLNNVEMIEHNCSAECTILFDLFQKSFEDYTCTAYDSTNRCDLFYSELYHFLNWRVSNLTIFSVYVLWATKWLDNTLCLKMWKIKPVKMCITSPNFIQIYLSDL